MTNVKKYNKIFTKIERPETKVLLTGGYEYNRKNILFVIPVNMRKLDYENYLKEKKVRLVKKETPGSNELDASMMLDYLKYKKKIERGDIIEINNEKFIVK